MRDYLGATELSGVKFNSGLLVSGANADPQTLDDYEEGTFTPQVAFGGTAIESAGTPGTYASRNGYYTKKGREVSFVLSILLSAKPSGANSTGVFTVKNLPFVSASNSNNETAVSLRFGGLAYTGMAQAYLPSNSTAIQISQVVEAGTVTNSDDTKVSATMSLIISGTYIAA
jgi:hypothetical protein